MVVHVGTNWWARIVHSLVLTDVASGWTECLAIPVRRADPYREAIYRSAAQTPVFPCSGLNTDTTAHLMKTTRCYDIARSMALSSPQSRPIERMTRHGSNKRTGQLFAS